MRSDSRTLPIKGGWAAADMTSQTGVKVEVKGSSAFDGANVKITAMDLGSTTPSGAKAAALNSPYFFDVLIQQISDGVATVTLSSSSVKNSTVMQYWKGNSWVGAANRMVSGKTVSGDIPVSDLNGTPIVIGT